MKKRIKLCFVHDRLLDILFDKIVYLLHAVQYYKKSKITITPNAAD